MATIAYRYPEYEIVFPDIEITGQRGEPARSALIDREDEVLPLAIHGLDQLFVQRGRTVRPMFGEVHVELLRRDRFHTQAIRGALRDQTVDRLLHGRGGR